MKFNDAISGAVLLVLALAVLVNIQSFPVIPGQNVGPAAFPGLLAGLLLVCSLLLILKGLKERASQGWVNPGLWLKSWPHLRSFVVTIAAMLFYVFASDRIGFIPAALVVLLSMFWTLGVRRRLMLPIALVVVLVIHTIFYKGLRVPLPWGWLQSIAW